MTSGDGSEPGSLYNAPVQGPTDGGTTSGGKATAPLASGRPLIHLDFALLLGRAGGSTYWLLRPARNEQAGQHGDDEVAHSDFSHSAVPDGGTPIGAYQRGLLPGDVGYRALRFDSSCGLS